MAEKIDASIDALRTRLSAFCEHLRDKGFDISRRGDYGSAAYRGLYPFCLVGAARHGLGLSMDLESGWYGRVAEELGLEVHQLDAIEHGFCQWDSFSAKKENLDLYKLGDELGTKYAPPLKEGDNDAAVH